MNGSPTPPPVSLAPDFKDRRTGLIVFGILEMVLGALAALMIPLMILGQVMAAQNNQEPMAVRQLTPALVSYLVISAALITVGIGSCKTRRWARALSLVLAWSWLAIGVISMVMMAFFMPSILKNSQPPGQQVPEAALLIGLIVGMVFMGILFIVVPGVLVLFYRSPHVKATCKARNPSPSWTDACPLPVLGMSLWLGLGAVCTLAMPLSTHGVLPAFGKVLSGLGGSLCCVALALLWGYCAWAVYRLRSAGWWIVLISLCIVSVSAWITFSHIDLPELYRVMGYSDRQIDTMKQFSFMQGNRMAYWSVAGVVPMLGFLLFVKRYFRSPA
ncbi:MAG TPA: hypothetical protein VL361_00480 [Candidatus Limnocylindrales bacterium]|jgi:hypothetical protein|nr:hypothetical protein [Candidatus Limnocylindrales bacterium]